LLISSPLTIEISSIKKITLGLSLRSSSKRI
jgi:hypothetical protein